MNKGEDRALHLSTNSLWPDRNVYSETYLPIAILSYECPKCVSYFQDVGCFRAHKVSHKLIMKGLSQFRSLKNALKEFISSGLLTLHNWKFKCSQQLNKVNISKSWLWLTLLSKWIASLYSLLLNPGEEYF